MLFMVNKLAVTRNPLVMKKTSTAIEPMVMRETILEWLSLTCTYRHFKSVGCHYSKRSDDTYKFEIIISAQ